MKTILDIFTCFFVFAADDAFMIFYVSLIAQ